MAKSIAKFTVACTAVYTSELEIPEEIKNNRELIIEYIRDNLDKANVNELTWLNDFDPEDAVTDEDILYIYNEDDEVTA